MNTVRIIRLKKDTRMSTGYRGRGLQSMAIEVPAGTEVRYERKETLSGTYHTVYFKKDGIEYDAAIKDTAN